MDLLAYYYHNRPNNDFFIPRKCTITEHKRINLHGPRASGKSSLVLEYIDSYAKDKSLYIDLDDPNLFFDEISEATLRHYLIANNITLLVLDHCDKIPSWDIEFVEQVILISRHRLSSTWYSIALSILDYEEFLGSEHTISQSNGFSHFFKSGGIPLMAKATKNHQLVMKNILQSKFDLQESHLLSMIARHNTKHMTTNQIYTFAKKEFKISKDWLYKKIEIFKDEGVLLILPDILEKSGKKIILYDIALARYLNANQPFAVYFDALVGLHLIHQGTMPKTLGIHGYITQNTLTMVAPFESEESVWAKNQKRYSLFKKYGIKNIHIITVSNTYSYTIGDIPFEAMPFYEWSLTDFDNP